MNEKIKDISILVVEDEDELREELSEYIGLFFERIFSASNASTALSIYKNKKPDIIISDINMPDSSGLDLIANIRKNDTQTKILILSAHSDQEKLLRAIKLHLETYLIKPVKMDELKSILLDMYANIKKTTKRAYATQDIYWDYKTDSIWCQKEEIELKNKERLLLKFLFSKPKHIFSAEEIFAYLHMDKTNKEFSNYSITSLIKRIRIKLPQDIIQNIYGAGYKIDTI